LPGESVISCHSTREEMIFNFFRRGFIFWICSAILVLVIQTFFYVGLPTKPTLEIEKLFEAYRPGKRIIDQPVFLKLITAAYPDEKKGTQKFNRQSYLGAQKEMVKYFTGKLKTDYRRAEIQINSIISTINLKSIRSFSNQFMADALKLSQSGKLKEANQRIKTLYKFSQYLGNAADQEGRNWDLINYAVALGIKRLILKSLLEEYESQHLYSESIKTLLHEMAPLLELDLSKQEVFQRGMKYADFSAGMAMVNAYDEAITRHKEGTKQKLILQYTILSLEYKTQYLNDYREAVNTKGLTTIGATNDWLSAHSPIGFNLESLKIYPLYLLGVTLYPPALADAVARGIALTMMIMALPNHEKLLVKLDDTYKMYQKLVGLGPNSGSR